jgi:predicted ABC-type ATPase
MKEKGIADLEMRKKELKSQENISSIADEVLQERIAKKIAYKPLGEVVADFEKLNYLLSDKKLLTFAEKTIFDSCPPRENGELAISDEALAYLDKCLESQGQTKPLYQDPDTGLYKPERHQLHVGIIRRLFANVRCLKQGKPIAVFTGGSPGAGKTHFLRTHAQYLLSQDVFQLDADDIRSMLPEYEGWNANRTHNESQDIVNETLNKIGEGTCRYDFIYDGTMNKANKYFTLIKRAKEMGFETFIIFVNIPFGVAKKRVLERYKKTGRYVPISVLEEFHQRLSSGKSRGLDALDQLKPMVDGYIVVNGINGEIVERGGSPLPADREYGRFLNAPTPAEAVVLPSAPLPENVIVPNDKEQIESYIETLILSMKYLFGPEKKEAKDQIKAFKVSLKFL